MGKSYTPWFPDPGSYIRYWDTTTRTVKYRHTQWRRMPITYDQRFASLAAAATSNPVSLPDIRPSKDKSHIYLAYLGIRPGVMCEVYHPTDAKILKWDEAIDDIDENKTGVIDYRSSPFEFPVFAIGMDYEHYPALKFRNVSGEALNPWISIVAAMYLVVEHEKLSPDELQRLNDGRLKSYPWDFGGSL